MWEHPTGTAFQTVCRFPVTGAQTLRYYTRPVPAVKPPGEVFSHSAKFCSVCGTALELI